MCSHPLRPLLASLVLASIGTAQTWVGGTSLNWADAANWDPAVVPDGAGAIATFTPAGLASGTSDLILTGSHTLAGIHFAANTPAVVLFTDNAGSPAVLTLTGDGLRNDGTTKQTLWLSSPSFAGTETASLTFLNQATVAGDIKLIGIGSDRTIAFRDQSSAGSAQLFAYVVDFHDQATAGSAVFDQYLGTVFTFHDQATAGSAQLPTFAGSITFADASSADHATVVRTSPYYGGWTHILFRDQAHAGHANFNSALMEFAGSSSAESAVLANAGVQYYSSHGQYATNPATLVFREAATAGQAQIGVNPLGTTTWTDDATAASATIANHGTLVWSGRAAFANARVMANSGSYYGYGGYNQQAPSVPTGGIYFRDQAVGGAGRIEIASAGAWLDFSGLDTGLGTTGRSAVASSPAGAAIAADDAVTFSLGAITNTVAGGTIYLGSTVLHLGAGGADMTLSALIRDTGGAYGSAAGEPLRGGSLVKVGTGVLTLANPANDYAGPTIVSAGTVHLTGGRISATQVLAPARLTGHGTVAGTLTNHGVVVPDPVGGTLVIGGDYVQAADGRLVIALGSGAASGRLDIAGTATLGGTLELDALDGHVPVGNTQYAILSAGATAGQFDTIELPVYGAALTTAVVTTPTGLSVAVTQHSFAGLGAASPATAALGAQLDATLPGAAGEYRDLVAGLNLLPDAGSISTALTALAPDRYAVLADHAFLGAMALQAAQDRRFAAMREPAARGFAAFFDAGQRRARFAAAPGLPAARSTVGFRTAGGSWHRAGLTLGATVTRENSALDLDDVGSRAEIGSTIPALFAGYSGRLGFVHATAAFGRDDYGLRRHVHFNGTDRLATADTGGTRQDFALSFGRDLTAGRWTLTPQGGVLASRWQIDGFTETGAAGASLVIARQSLTSWRTRVGLDLARRGQRFTPRVAVSWLHENGDARTVRAAFAGATSAVYTTPGRGVDADLVQASVGFDWQVSRQGGFQITVAGVHGNATRVTSDLSAGVHWRF